MPFDREAALLQEYQLCNEKVGRLDSLIWTMASIVFPITLAGLSYYGLSSTHTPEQFVAVLIVGIGSIALLTLWYSLSRVWHSFQSVAYYRMREVEAELGLWHYRYSLFLKQSKKGRKATLARIDQNGKERFEHLGQQVSGFVRIGLRATTTIITIIFVLSWIGLVPFHDDLDITG